MANKTDIEWADYSSNPIRARHTNTGKLGWFCSHASPGCEHCYAETINRRFGNGLTYAAPNLKSVEFVLNEKELASWLNIPAGKTVFPFDMTDLFQDGIPDEMVCRCLRQMARCLDVTFMVLTKRPKRAREFMIWLFQQETDLLPNLWLGVSVEDQRRADERLPVLLDTPAAVRFVSAEPLLGPVDLARVAFTDNGLNPHHCDYRCRWLDALGGAQFAGDQNGDVDVETHRLDWCIIGGESGGGARPCDIGWIRSLVDQCRTAEVAPFVKQLGRWIGGSSEGFNPSRYLLDDLRTVFVPPVLSSRHRRPSNAVAFSLLHPKGGDMSEWPEALRVREMPADPARASG